MNLGWTVAPGPVWTPLIPATMALEKVQKFGKATLFKRPAQPSELAALYVFLATDEAGYGREEASLAARRAEKG